MPGLFFDELTVEQIFKHPIRRTITEADNVWFSCLAYNPAYHLDEQYCRETLNSVSVSLIAHSRSLSWWVYPSTKLPSAPQSLI